jgi:hypothetical protein
MSKNIIRSDGEILSLTHLLCNCWHTLNSHSEMMKEKFLSWQQIILLPHDDDAGYHNWRYWSNNSPHTPSGTTNTVLEPVSRHTRIKVTNFDTFVSPELSKRLHGESYFQRSLQLSADQEIRLLLWNLKVHWCTTTNPGPIPVKLTPPTAAARVQTRVWSCGILWWTKVALGQVFSEKTSISPAQSTFHLLLHNHLQYHPSLAQ